ncbi:geranylgeranyl pyrophosphate synthase [Bipolaris maydis]|nr:isoprenoid synthase domain-containing protein [Bipolaris maydis]KAJ6197757.1 geranylgeranyl pyrophosphate synthase [Bipolaris maydis]
MEAIFQYSSPVDIKELSKNGYFSQLMPRINHRDDLANAATRKLLSDWAGMVGDGWESESNSSLSEVGNWCSLVFPETKPERIGTLTYLTDLGLIHDDNTEAMSSDLANQEHKVLSAALNGSDNSSIPGGSRSQKIKNLAAQFLLEAMSIDYEKGTRMIKAYRKKWLEVMDSPPSDAFNDISSYLKFRMSNGGMDPFWAMVLFGMDITLTDDEIKATQHVMDAVDCALVLTNDYYSFDREYAAVKSNPEARIVNGVFLLMQNGGIDEVEARSSIRDLIVEYESQFLVRWKEYQEKNTNMSMNLRRFIEGAGAIVAGNHWWCTVCPRHHSSKTQTAKTPQTHAAPSKPLPAGGPKRTDSATSIDTVSITPQLSQEPLVEPIDYLKSMPSKGVRKALIDSLNVWFDVPTKKVKSIEEIIDTLHQSSLILDDIEDNSGIRRGLPSVHTIYGQAQAINSATYMFVRAVSLTSSGLSPKGLSYLLEGLERLFVGQSWDLYWKHNLICPSKEEYLQMVDGKTGSMFRMLVELMEVESLTPCPPKTDKLIFLLGRYFQIRDDYMNLVSKEYAAQKGTCEDLEEGKFSFPIVVCIEDCPPSKGKILGLFRQHAAGQKQQPIGMGDECKNLIMQILNDGGALATTKSYLLTLEDSLKEEIRCLEVKTGKTNSLLTLLIQTLSLTQ